MAGLAAEIDRLFASVATDPGRWGDEALAAWMQDLASVSAVGRTEGRWLRRAMRLARRLRDHALRAEVSDWRIAVDEALGSRGWEPALRLSMADLERHPTHEGYEDVSTRYRSVYFQPWQDGASYEEWLAGRAQSDGE